MKKLFHKGVTMIELVVSLALMGLVTTAAVSVLTLGVHGFNATKQVIDVTMADTDFATRISTAIRNSGTSFTIPQNSFKQANFTQGWNYLGLMSHVFIDKTISRTGEEIQDADALVYVEWYKPTEDDPVPDETKLAANQSVYHSSTDGDFIITILGHSYVDRAGIARNYTLTFEPTDPDNHAAQSVKYTFGTLGDSDATIETVLESINAIQTVYQGSKTNPATAIAFRSDFNSSNYSSTSTEGRDVYGTIVLLLDVSGSMGPSQNNLEGALKESASGFLNTIAASNEHMNALITTFGSYANSPSNFNTSNPTLDVVNIGLNRSALVNGTINKIKSTGSTNLGGAIRVAYWKLHDYEASLNATISRTPDTDDGSVANPIHLVILSDGAMNIATVDKRSGAQYTGPLNYFDDRGTFTSNNKTTSQTPANGRNYFTTMANLFKTAYNPSVYVVNLNFGMARGDRDAIANVFPDYQEFNASNFAEMEAAFSEIGNRINSQMWAFEGPKL